VVTQVDPALGQVTSHRVPVSERDALTGYYERMSASTFLERWLWSTGSDWVDAQLLNVGVAPGMTIGIDDANDLAQRASAVTEMKLLPTVTTVSNYRTKRIDAHETSPLCVIRAT
jgi:hypothetical protein